MAGWQMPTIETNFKNITLLMARNIIPMSRTPTPTGLSHSMCIEISPSGNVLAQVMKNPQQHSISPRHVVASPAVSVSANILPMADERRNIWNNPYLLLCITLQLIVNQGQANVYQNKILFALPQAQRLWDDKDILGNSTSFNYPLSAGTYTSCDHVEILKIFYSNYTLRYEYTHNEPAWSNGSPQQRPFLKNYAFRYLKPNRTIEKHIYSPQFCIMACVTEREFRCQGCDYFKLDGGVCALYSIKGYNGNIYAENYVGPSRAADHYRVFWDTTEDSPPCNISVVDYPYHSFALGWKAMEAGWYNLAHSMFSTAIRSDSGYYMAYIGKTLANDKMGYGMSDTDIGNYREVLVNISVSEDVELRLTYQQQLVLKSLLALHTADNLTQGVRDMNTVFVNDKHTIPDYVIDVLKGNALMLAFDSCHALESLTTSSHNVFALQLLLHNSNPYQNVKVRLSSSLTGAALSAVFTFQRMGVRGAKSMNADCVDIAEYFGQWSLALARISEQTDFLYRNSGSRPLDLLTVRDDKIYVNGLHVEYMSLDAQRVNELERYHFFQLQLALFTTAEQYLADHTSSIIHNNDDDDLILVLKHRMTANAYFTTYNYIYEEYAKNIVFISDWALPLNSSDSDIVLVSRAYYWTAAAVQLIRAGNVEEAEIIHSSLSSVLKQTSKPFYTLIQLYELIVGGTKYLRDGDIDAAITSAKEASKLQDELVGADFTIRGNEESEEFKMLIPLGYQFEADILRHVVMNQIRGEKSQKLVVISDVVAAYRRGINTPPLNNSRLLKGYGESLKIQYGDQPKVEGSDIPAYVQVYQSLLYSWRDSDIEDFPARNNVLQEVDDYYNEAYTGCLTDRLIVRSGAQLCWGGYVTIGISSAIFVIVFIVLGILYLRRKAVAMKHCGSSRDEAFIFSGPDMFSSRGSLASSSIQMSTLGSRGYHNRTLQPRKSSYIADEEYLSKRRNTYDANFAVANNLAL